MKKTNLFELVETTYNNVERWIGYPVNQKSNMGKFYKWYTACGFDEWLLNNVGDPYVGNNLYRLNSLEIEKEVIENFAPKYGMNPKDIWGFVTHSGTDGNNHGIYYGSKWLYQKTGMLPIVYVSEEAHYSSRRLCDLQNLEVRLIGTDINGRMDLNDLRDKIDPSKPALVIVALGSTFMGAIDDQVGIDRVLKLVKPIAYYRHVDAALFGGYLPFTKQKDLVSMEKMHYDSIAISGHKFFGVDEPCGLFFIRKEVFDAQKTYKVEYLENSIPTIWCSRNALLALKFRFVLDTVGFEGLEKQAKAFLDNTEYLQKKLDEIGYPAWHNQYSNTVFFKRPNKEIIYKYALAGGYNKDYGGELNHIVVMQHVTPKIIDQFISDIKKMMEEEGK